MQYLSSRRWPNGFSCPKCGHDRSYLLSVRRLYECKKCRYQTSVIAGTVFHASKVSLTKWFWAIYWISSSKDEMSALQLSQLIGVSWRTARVMIGKLRAAVGSPSCLYRMNTVVELDAALIESRVKVPARAARSKAKILIAGM